LRDIRRNADFIRRIFATYFALEQAAGQQKCAQEIANHRLDDAPSAVFEINQLLKERRSPARSQSRESIVIDSQANFAAPTISII
jgi:hypothetical protein